MDTRMPSITDDMKHYLDVMNIKKYYFDQWYYEEFIIEYMIQR